MAGMLRPPHLLSPLWNVLAQGLMGEWEEVPEGQASVSLPKRLRELMEDSGFPVSGGTLAIWIETDPACWFPGARC